MSAVYVGDLQRERTVVTGTRRILAHAKRILCLNDFRECAAVAKILRKDNFDTARNFADEYDRLQTDGFGAGQPAAAMAIRWRLCDDSRNRALVLHEKGNFDRVTTQQLTTNIVLLEPWVARHYVIAGAARPRKNAAKKYYFTFIFLVY